MTLYQPCLLPFLELLEQNACKFFRTPCSNYLNTRMSLTCPATFHSNSGKIVHHALKYHYYYFILIRFPWMLKGNFYTRECKNSYNDLDCFILEDKVSSPVTCIGLSFYRHILRLSRYLDMIILSIVLKVTWQPNHWKFWIRTTSEFYNFVRFKC